jgi:hypothetical protein
VVMGAAPKRRFPGASGSAFARQRERFWCVRARWYVFFRACLGRWRSLELRVSGELERDGPVGVDAIDERYAVIAVGNIGA